MKTNNLLPNGSLLDGISEPELLNALADGAYITDLDRKILFWNHAAERITGWRAADVVGKSCFDNLLCHVDKDGRCLCGHDTCPLHRSIITNQPSDEPVLVFARCKSQRRLPVEVSVAPLTNAAGEVIGGIEIFRDRRDSLDDLLRAKSIQEQSLFSHLPGDRRVEFQTVYSARDIVGGDFYRIEQINPNHYALLVADAIGHGVAAALYTMQLRMLWDDHRDKLGTPAFFMRTINSRLHALVQDAGFFCTAAYVLYDATCGHLRCIRAGHPGPVIFRGDRQTEIIGQSQCALGMLPDSHYTEFQAQLAPGDTLLMFTDGATEIFDAGDNQLETAGLIRLAHGVMADQPDGRFNLEKLAEKLLAFSNQIHLADDLTLLKLRRLA
jgi:PAS domain S-box-containing protein